MEITKMLMKITIPCNNTGSFCSDFVILLNLYIFNAAPLGILLAVNRLRERLRELTATEA